MGLLDDAIREHLELKRRHGADPEEVSRQEREALGAPQRGEFAQPEGAAPEEAEVESAEVESAEVAPPAAEPEPTPAAEPPPAPEEEARADPAPGYKEEEPWLPDEKPADGAEPAKPAEGEDVLEETPEFLQETPEHDRLWFEQKPPRDFDWDK